MIGLQPTRSTSQLRCRSRFAPVPAASSLGARCQHITNPGRPLHRLPLPLGDFAPSGSMRHPVLLPVGSPSDPVRSPFAPRFPSLFLVQKNGSSLRSATFSKACCSSNLLEPTSLCAPPGFLVNRFCKGIDTFPQYFSPINHKRLGFPPTAFHVDKTRGLNPVPEIMETPCEGS